MMPNSTQSLRKMNFPIANSTMQCHRDLLLRSGMEESKLQRLYTRGVDRQFKMSMWEQIREIHSVTGLWPALNDVPLWFEDDFRSSDGPACQLFYRDLVGAAHRLFLTGVGGRNGSWGPIDVHTSFCWISNNSTRTKTRRVREGFVVSLDQHCRFSYADIPYIPVTHVSYGYFKSRLALFEMARQVGTKHCSHLCHEPGCANPLHLVSESPAENAARNACRGLLCLGRHQEPACCPTFLDKQQTLHQIYIKRRPMSVDQRLVQMAENPPKVMSAVESDNLAQKTAIVQQFMDPRSSDEALRIYRLGLSAMEE